MANFFGNLLFTYELKLRNAIYWNPISFPLKSQLNRPPDSDSPSYLPLHKGKWVQLDSKTLIHEFLYF